MACQQKARELVEMLDMKQDLPDRRNRSTQQDCTSCGFWLMFYWEGHVRQFMGEGWSIGRGDQKSATKILDRLRKTCKDIADGVKAPLKKRSKDLDIEDEPLINALPAAPSLADVDAGLAHLKVEAERAKRQGAVEFYGCSKCRWSRSGCIYWKCNPYKYQEHRKKFPEKYGDTVAGAEGQELKVNAEKKMKPEELLGVVTA